MNKPPGHKIWNETIYNELLQLIVDIEDHPWGKTLNQRDAARISQIRQKILSAANDLYTAKQEIMEDQRKWHNVRLLASEQELLDCHQYLDKIVPDEYEDETPALIDRIKRVVKERN